MLVWSQGNSSSLHVIGILLPTFLLTFVQGTCAFEYEQFQIGQTTNVRRLRFDIHLLSIRCQFEDYTYVNTKRPFSILDCYWWIFKTPPRVLGFKHVQLS